MPIKKTSPASKPRKTVGKKDEDTLMEFEQFVSQKPSAPRNKSWLAMTFIIIIVVLGAIWLFMSKVDTMEKSHKFKAIYLDNGETYYAKVVKEDALNIYLDEVYYIQMQQQWIQPQPTEEEEEPEPQLIDVPVLIKRGQEIHRPEGYLTINRSKLIATEIMGDDSEIVAEISRINQQQ